MPNLSLLTKLFYSLALIFVLSTAPFASAHEADRGSKSSMASINSPEMKKNMADMYQKMADCMRTDKSMHECHETIIKDCPMMKETGHCPMMDGAEDHDEKMSNKKMKHGDMKGMKGMNGMGADEPETHAKAQ